MAKDSGEHRLFVGVLFLLRSLFPQHQSKGKSMKPQVKKTQKDVIAYRKSCTAKGTGLSHYILMDKPAKKAK